MYAARTHGMRTSAADRVRKYGKCLITTIIVLSTLRSLELSPGAPQMEMLVILTHLTGRTLVLPDHLAADNLFMMRPPVSLWDFYDFEHLRQWIPAISMNQYLDIRSELWEDPLTSNFW